MATTRKQFLPLMGLTAVLAAGVFGGLMLVNPHRHQEQTAADREKAAATETGGVFAGTVENPPAEANTSMPTMPAGSPAAIVVQGSNAAGGGCAPGTIPDPNAAAGATATPASGATATPASGAAAAPASGATATPTTGAATSAPAAAASPACIPDPAASTVATAATGAVATPTTVVAAAPTDGGTTPPATDTTTTATTTSSTPSTDTTVVAAAPEPSTPAATDTSASATSGSSSSSSSTTSDTSSSGGTPSTAEIRRMIRREAQKIARAEVRKALRARGMNEDGSSMTASADDKPAKTRTTTKTTRTKGAPTAGTPEATETTTASATPASDSVPTPATASTTTPTEVATTTTTTTSTDADKPKSGTGKMSAGSSSAKTMARSGPAASALTSRPQADALRAWWNDTNRGVGAFTLVYAGQPKDQTSIALLFSEPPAVDTTATGIKVVDKAGSAVSGAWTPAAGNPRLLLLSGLTPGRYTVVVNQNMKSTQGKGLISEQSGPIYIR